MRASRATSHLADVQLRQSVQERIEKTVERTMSSIDIPGLSIGDIIGGPSLSNRGWDDPLRLLTIEVADQAIGLDTPLKLNVIFQVPGPDIRPDFEGVRTGYYSKKDNLLIVQAAVPEEPPADALGMLRTLLASAIDAAEEWARRRGLAPDLGALRQCVEGTT